MEKGLGGSLLGRENLPPYQHAGIPVGRNVVLQKVAKTIEQKEAKETRRKRIGGPFGA